ncbi:6-phosphogluconolactonase [bacterium]|nr:6-phosphogluconolactonase [bacterium]
MIVCKDELELGVQAASNVANKIRELLANREEIRVVFAAGESQMTFLDALATEKNIDWQRIVCFNVDDFYDTNMPEEFTCGYQTRKQLYNKVNPKQVHLVRYDAPDPDEEAKRFEAIIRESGGFDVLCQGIGTSGHLALNEPFATDFEERAWVKVVNLAEQSKIQLRDDPNFNELGYIPSKGITMTIPVLMSAKSVYTMVPLALKRPIMERLFALKAPTTELPASVLLQFEGTLYIDRNSCPQGLWPET